MNLIFYLLLLLAGFILLIKGAQYFVEGASSFAKKLSVSEIVIGLTIVAFGTSAPELVVNLFSAINGKTDFAFGNIIGSCNVNILLILGVAGLIKPIASQKNTVWREIPFALHSSTFPKIDADSLNYRNCCDFVPFWYSHEPYSGCLSVSFW